MLEWLASISSTNVMSVLIVVVVLASIIQGTLKGASGSARHLYDLVVEGVVTVVSLLLAWQLMEWLSPVVHRWLTDRAIAIPDTALSIWQQIYYTFITGVRDFSLMRSGILFIIGYVLCKNILLAAVRNMSMTSLQRRFTHRSERITWISSLLGGVIGTLTGTGRAIIIIAVLFIYAAIFPNSAFTRYVQQSDLYQKGATEVIAPFTGNFIVENLPVFTRAVEAEFNQILQRKYEVLDSNIPATIAEAAKEVTAASGTEEEKARALYQWIGTRVQYDWNKVKLYEEKRIWNEQTPEDTFATRKGVCIDYSRLYAVMARSIDLDVKVVTGLGYNGQGGYGLHAWNEVFISQRNEWVPLDSTWVSSGGNWFNPPNFAETHIKDA